MKKFGALLLACVLSFSLVGCGNNDGGSDAAASGSGDVSGTVALNGSTSMEKLVNGLKEGIVETYPNLQLEPQFTGSSAGIEAVTNGTADIGDVSRALTDEEKAGGLVENIVALDGIAVVTDTANTATNLTTQQLKDIYTGKITNWSEVGGADQNIVVIGRESGSGTRDAFEEILDIADQCQLAQTLNETGAVAAAVQSTPGAIGYISLDALNDKVKALQLDGVAPSEETVKDGSYTLQRPFVMATKGEISEQSAQVQAVFEFINSDAGQEVISSVGLVSAK
ncbi:MULTISPECIES: phosphate ABC transporter substrate-binding protein [unclassified Massilimicrobiota]|jgi:phosphate transport system substrate-binding protein|uniref:phosphate ABC transporter substrate-binding protein n=1 Tax=unclassified Massilimicrobiota TaxID=2619866 RepID=UPI000B3839F2|nr:MULTISPECIES: phosphate ABC transporter substrate-binding protein [unclassified Massilimicrobiota]MEE0778608.1 phosphate ABC transporter substrate-binding protein [Massilimicrobiota sp.]OUN34381.1 phosphate ABC transporter substrate-binding protein [Massilimicrobiota sp. An80]OUQ74929.1 phosphate ABC transporter substrate-binding protein [Massilimicrobiota sp. An105]